MISKLENYYTDKPEVIAECLIAMRSIIKSHGLVVGEAFKWGLPVFHSEDGKNVCYFHVEKKSGKPYMCFINSNVLDAFPMLEKDDRKVMKALKFNPNEDLPKDLIIQILDVLQEDYVKNSRK